MLRQSKKSLDHYYERWILTSTIILLLFGLLMVTSSSMVISDRQFGYPFHYVLHHLIYIILGVFFAAIASRIPIAFWNAMSLPLILLGIFLLVIVLFPGVGHTINGSRRWLYFGAFSLQVSEFVKLTALLYLAGYLQRHLEEVCNSFLGFLKPIILLGMLTILLLMEPDFGACAVLSIMFLSLLFIAGVRLWSFVALLVLVGLVMTTLAITSPYRLERLTTFLNPWGVQYGSGYQLTQSLIAFGRGGLLGVGLGNSVQKLFYLPEAQSDFLFAVIAEELGLVGVLAFVFLFTYLIIRIFRVGRMAQQLDQIFASYLAYGAAIWLGLQGMINMGVNSGVLPTKGLTLPFISYGGSSLLINCLVIGIVLRVYSEMQGSAQEKQYYRRRQKK